MPALLGPLEGGAQRAGDLEPPLGQQPLTPDQNEPVAVERRLHTEALAIAEGVEGGQKADLVARCVGDRPRDRML